LYFLAACVFLVAACSVPAEQPIVGDFFAASRLRDTTQLARFATVVFEPRDRGIVDRFEILSVSPERPVDGVRHKDVLVDAVVRRMDGGVRSQRLLVSLELRHADGTNAAPPLYGGWVVTAVTDAPASPGLPRS
jgi:hypothetical protein